MIHQNYLDYLRTECAAEAAAFFLFEHTGLRFTVDELKKAVMWYAKPVCPLDEAKIEKRLRETRAWLPAQSGSGRNPAWKLVLLHMASGGIIPEGIFLERKEILERLDDGKSIADIVRRHLEISKAEPYADVVRVVGGPDAMREIARFALSIRQGHSDSVTNAMEKKYHDAPWYETPWHKG